MLSHVTFSTLLAAPRPHIKAIVVSKHRVANRGFVVTLSVRMPQLFMKGARFTWDYNGDGAFETPLRPNPTLVHIYTNTLTSHFTATVRVVGGWASGALSRVSFRAPH